MTDSKKRGKLPPQIKSVGGGGERPLLTDEESAILAAYREMDNDAQCDAVLILKVLSSDSPRAPRLRLVSAVA